MVTYVYRDSQRLTPWMDYQIGRLNADCIRLFGVRVIVSSAIRTYGDQKRIFLERYVTAGGVGGRRVYDTRWWNGQLWYRVSSAGTVAVPGTSNHEIQGSKAAVDLRDSGSDAGITVAGSRRANWLRANAGGYGLIASGYGFGEPWHYDVLDIHNTPPSAPAGGGGSTPELLLKEDDMIRIQAPGRGIALIGPGYYRHLASDEEVNNSAPLISAHHSGNDRQFDLWVSMALSGNVAGDLSAVIRTESRPVKLYQYDGKIIAVGEGGKVWDVPSDAYRILLDALGVAGPNILRAIPTKDELDLLQMILGRLNPDPSTEVKVDAVLAISDSDAERIAGKIKTATPQDMATEFARRLTD